MNEITLRPYQQECIDIINSLESGSYLIAMSVGLGKTVIFSHIKRRGKVLILSHREELVYQPQKYYDCSFGVERAKETSNGEEVVSASVQSLINRLDKFDPEEFDTIITDECHHSVSPSYRKIYDYFHPRLHLGFTATPNRADKVSLGEIFEKIIYQKDIKWGIQNNYLSDIECKRVNIGYDLRDVHIRMGDYAQNELSDTINKEMFNEAVAQVYKEYAVGPTLIFAASVEHAQNIASLIPGAEVITHTTENRAEILEGFKQGTIPCIVNNMILTEGTDLPNVQTIIINRPTKNISLYIQMVGRGCRLSPGKDKLHLIDCVGVSSMDICTAPQLFGIDSKIAEETGESEGLLSTMESRVEKVQQDRIVNRDFWKFNVELINLFSDNGNKYDLHKVNYTMMGNGDLVCSIGDAKSIRITAEDMVGNCSIILKDKRDVLIQKDNIKVQDALNEAQDILIRDYIKNKSIWNEDSAKKWFDDPATTKQKELIRKMYKVSELIRMKIKMNELNKYQASVLINRKFSERG